MASWEFHEIPELVINGGLKLGKSANFIKGICRDLLLMVTVNHYREFMGKATMRLHGTAQPW